MRRVGYAQAMILSLGLGGCAVAPPTGPDVVALPGKDKSFEAFQADDAACRQYASAQIGNISPADAANQSAAGSAVLGTVAGAAAGAVIGAAAGNPAAGAAIGAGSGLVIGGATGLSAAQASGATLQWRYDLGYVQCMSAKGENVQLPIAGYPAYPYGPYDPYYLPYYGGARLGIGFGFHSHHSHHSHH